MLTKIQEGNKENFLLSPKDGFAISVLEKNIHSSVAYGSFTQVNKWRDI